MGEVPSKLVRAAPASRFFPEEKNWHAVTLENLKKHFLAVFSGSYVGESVALAVNDIVAGGATPPAPKPISWLTPKLITAP